MALLRMSQKRLFATALNFVCTNNTTYEALRRRKLLLCAKLQHAYKIEKTLAKSTGLDKFQLTAKL